MTVAHHDPAAAQDHGELRRREQRRGFIEALLAAGAALDRDRPRNLAFDVAIKKVARNVELRGSHFQLREVERAARKLRHASAVVHMGLELRDPGEDRQLLGLLKAAEPDRCAAGFRRDHDNRRMRPERRRSRGDEIGDPRTVLRDAHAVAAGHARVAVGHVAGALLVRDRDEADAGERKKVERIHVRRPDDAEDILDPVGHQRLDEGFGRRHLLLAGHGRR